MSVLLQLQLRNGFFFFFLWFVKNERALIPCVMADLKLGGYDLLHVKRTHNFPKKTKQKTLYITLTVPLA